MDRKDWLGLLFAVSIGVFGALAGSLATGYQYERAALRQAQMDQAIQT